MADATVKAIFAGDSTSLDRTFSKVGAGAKSMASDFDSATAKTKSFGGAVDGMNDKVDASESKFMGAADLLDGLGGAFGLPTEGVTNLARSFGDLAGGFTSIIGPAISKVAAMLGIQTAATATQTAATEGAAVAQGGLNAALFANPIGLVVAGLVALGVALFVAWKKSETFRDVVRGAFDTVKGAAVGVWDFLRSLPDKIGSLGGRLVDILTWPYRTAFNAIAGLWNHSVGALSFSVPSWVPGIGGKGWDIPDMPTFHQGGIVPGPRGAEVPIMAMAGERVTPAGAGGGGVTINVYGSVVTETQLIDAIHNGLLRKQKLTPLGLAS